MIVAIGTSAARAAQRATAEVPIVFTAGADPVAAGFVDSIAAPAGRMTGFHFLTADLTAKRLEVLREIVPKLRRVVILYNPGNRTAVSALEVAQQAASKLGIAVAAHRVSSPQDIRDRLRTLKGADAEAYFFMNDALITSHVSVIVETANAFGLPTMAHELGSGALAGYGPDFRAVWAPRRTTLRAF